MTCPSMITKAVLAPCAPHSGHQLPVRQRSDRRPHPDDGRFSLGAACDGRRTLLRLYLAPRSLLWPSFGVAVRDRPNVRDGRGRPRQRPRYGFCPAGGRMTRPSGRSSVGDYAIGYGEPPRHTRFAPRVSGNPRGRPRGASAGRADRLALKDIYRLITVREGEQSLVLPTVQSIVRQLGRLAFKDNRPARRTYFGTAQGR